MFLLSYSALLSAVFVAVAESAVVEKAYIITLSQGTNTSLSLGRRGIDHINEFHRRASSLDYTVRHEYASSEAFLGLSIKVASDAADEEIIAQLEAIAEVASVSRVYVASIPILPDQPKPLDPLLSFKNPPALNVAAVVTSNLASALQMGDVDKLHLLGIKGKGIKIGIIDTGIDYRHPALGAGFGPGKKIAGGYSFVLDNGTLCNSPDPLTTCYGGGHGTHVAGIIGMDSIPGGFDIVGVAPEASIYMYKALDCGGSGGSDSVLAAMLKAQTDGVQLISMSIGFGDQSFSGVVDPLAVVTKALTDANIAVIVANGNSGVESKYASELYSGGPPATDPTAIGVGAVSNSNFPLVYSATDSAGTQIDYASIYPLNFTDGADVFILDNGCNSDNWNSALAAIENVNTTIIAFQADTNCKATEAGNWNAAVVEPVIIMAFNANSSDPYELEYAATSPGYYGLVQIININAVDGAIFSNNYAAAGGYKKYKLFFTSSAFTSPPQVTGGLMDYYSGFGPTWHDYNLKPQISAPGGHILSTWPLGVLGGYAILSGTSMATPYLAGSYALVKSKYPTATWDQIRNLLQTTSQPLSWTYDKSLITATAQQGSGLVNVYNAIFSKGIISPGQLKINDVTHSQYGTGNITIKNTAGSARTYTLSHQGAGYMDYYLSYQEMNQKANYGTANFSKSTVTVQAGQSAAISFAVTPPNSVDPTKLPVFGGFIKVKDTTGEAFSIPYIGPPYSQFNTAYILITLASDGLPLPRISSGDTADIGFLEIKSTSGYTTVIPTVEWTQEFRVDLLPANTDITANNYGFNKSVTWDYLPSAVTPKTTIFGFKSFGNLVNRTGYLWPGSYGPSSVMDTGVIGPDGVKYLVGNGDYRILASVLRWGGTEGEKEDYDTWLGPIMRFLN